MRENMSDTEVLEKQTQSEKNTTVTESRIKNNKLKLSMTKAGQTQHFGTMSERHERGRRSDVRAGEVA